MANAVRGFPLVVRDYAVLRRARGRGGPSMPLRFNMPCPHDRYEASGVASGHYFHQDLWVAQRVCEAAPERHVDVGSRIDGFVAHVAAFRPVEVFDIRPLEARVRNISFRQCDFTQPPPELDGYCDSLSCLHALEHFGLGRYGDPLDWSGHLHGFAAMARLVRPGGTFYVSVPIGPEGVAFNAHRVFSVATILRMVAPAFDVADFAYVDDAGDLHERVDLTAEAAERAFGVTFGCGIFVLRKRV